MDVKVGQYSNKNQCNPHTNRLKQKYYIVISSDTEKVFILPMNTWIPKLKNTAPSIITKKNEILRYKSKVPVQDLYAKNYKMLMKEIKDNLNKWRDILYSWVRRLIIVEMSILSKLI